MEPIPYPAPRRIWVDGDQVYAEAYDGIVVVMTAEVALHVSRLLGTAGGNALMNRICPADGPPAPPPGDGR